MSDISDIPDDPGGYLAVGGFVARIRDLERQLAEERAKLQAISMAVMGRPDWYDLDELGEILQERVDAQREWAEERAHADELREALKTIRFLLASQNGEFANSIYKAISYMNQLEAAALDAPAVAACAAVRRMAT